MSDTEIQTVAKAAQTKADFSGRVVYISVKRGAKPSLTFALPTRGEFLVVSPRRAS